MARVKKEINLKAVVSIGKRAAGGNMPAMAQKVIEAGKHCHPQLKVTVIGFDQGKGQALTVKLHVEGEDEAAHDFAQATTTAVHDILEEGRKQLSPGLKVKEVREYNLDEEEEM